MEQRIGSKSQPLDAAAVNPAYIPGLTSPVPAEPEDAVEETGEAAAEETPSAAASDPAVPGDVVSAEAPDADAGSGAAADEESDAEPEGPVFEASDRRASIRADHGGVRLRLDDQEAEFRWDEIGAVETESPRFGKRFTVTVHTPDARWYPIEIEAAARSRFKEWEEQLDAVLDTYFEDGAEAEAEAEADVDVDVDVEGGREAAEAEPTDAEPTDAVVKDSEVKDSEPKTADKSAAKSAGKPADEAESR
ncbi:hypothetical protein [Streptomyces sp. NBC_00687]|uniref:hypothetical protein n=1 Tax=Streptomyces sp. NBC_00687 TaxID=2975807 RepID=UPI0022519A45|nr:hypothetical protein [Streptomyces sp. NBC_00687]MCX4916714.1 hypothetical protein [Streptomyces sp. NBC_00687]